MQNASRCCDLKNQKMGRFLEICLLLLLFDHEGYGYGLIEQLADFGFTGDELNIGSLYRSLRKLEDQDLVSSVWEETSQGPKRRVYTITEQGKGDLHNWIPILKERKARIEQVIDTYETKTDKTVKERN
ncbi:helix-turn-helix transcriptional regulator [Treponema sp.]